MSTPKAILNKIKNGDLSQVKEDIDNILNKPLDNDTPANKTTNALIHSNLIQNWLLALVKSLPALKKSSNLHTGAEVAITCCRGYCRALSELAVDKACVVLELSYHVLYSLQDKEHVDQVLELASLLYQMLQKETVHLTDGAKKVVPNLYTLCWSLPGKFSLPLTKELELKKWALLFLTKLPQRDKLTSLLTNIMECNLSHFRTTVDKQCVRDFTDMVRLVCRELENLSQQHMKITEQKSIQLIQLKLHILTINLFMELSDFDSAREALSALNDNATHPLTRVGLSVHQVVLALHEQNPTRTASADMGEKLLAMNKLLESYKSKLSDFNEALVLISLISTLFPFCGKFFIDDRTLLEHLSTACTVMLEVIDWSQKDLSDSRKTGDCSDEKAEAAKSKEMLKLRERKCECLARKIRLLIMTNRAACSNEKTKGVCEEFVQHATALQGLLNDKDQPLTEKAHILHQRALGFLCISMAQDSFQKGWYKQTTTLCHIAIEQKLLCKEPTYDDYSILVQSCEKQSLWLEGTNACIQALTRNPARLSSIATIWVKFKQQALHRNEMFKTLTLASVVESACQTSCEFSKQQLLLAEYHAWIHLSRRQYPVEHDLLVTMVTADFAGIQRAEVLLGLVHSMFLTELTYDERSVEELLDEVFRILENFEQTEDLQRQQGLACLFHYLSLHEAASQESRSLSEQDEETLLKPSIMTDGVTTTCTLEKDQSYLPWMEKAIDFLESSFLTKDSSHSPENADTDQILTTGQKRTKGKKELTDTSRTNSRTSAKDDGKRHSGNGVSESKGNNSGDVVVLVEMGQQLDLLLHCSLRLVNMKQFELAQRLLRMAKMLCTTLGSVKRSSEVTCLLSHTLVATGNYAEAESVLAEGGVDKNDIRLSLATAEVYMYTGRRAEAAQKLEKVLETGNMKTICFYLSMGAAKRLMSELLCFPSNETIATGHNNQTRGHGNQSSNHSSSSSGRYDNVLLGKSSCHHVLSLAYDAMMAHMSVINHVFKAEGQKRLDLWQCMHELLTSLYHLCRLYRCVGIPRDAVCYISIGIRLAQYTSLTSWTALFLNELLCVQAMEASFLKALNTLTAINTFYNVGNDTKRPAVRKPSNSTSATEKAGVKGNDKADGKKRTPSQTQSLESLSDDEGVQEVCFGFEDLTVTPVKGNGNISAETAEAADDNKTPERVAKCEELSSDKKRKLEAMTIPMCVCVRQKLPECPSKHMHGLCISTAVTFAQFLLQAGTRTSAQNVLNQICTKYDIFKTSQFLDPLAYIGKSVQNRAQDVLNSGVKLDQEILSSCLTASCIQAELHVYQKDYRSVHAAWQMISELEELGMFASLPHQTILISRLALCEASAYLLSTYCLEDRKQTTLPASADTKIDEATTQFQDLTIGARKKVAFDRDCNPIGENKSQPKSSSSDSNVFDKSDITLKADSFATPMKSKKKTVNAFATPKIPFMNQVFASTKKSKPPTSVWTPATRMQDLTALLDSDSDDGGTVVFPECKPVTPSVNKSTRKLKSKTEPRNSRAKKQIKIFEDDNTKPVVSKLDFVVEQDDSPVIDKSVTKAPNTKKKGGKRKSNDSVDIDEHDAKQKTIAEVMTDDSVCSEKPMNDRLSIESIEISPSPDIKRKVTGKSRNKFFLNRTSASAVKQTGPLTSDLEEGAIEATAAIVEKGILTEKLENGKLIKADIYDMDLEFENSPLTKSTTKGTSKTATGRKKKETSKSKRSVDKSTDDKVAREGDLEKSMQNEDDSTENLPKGKKGTKSNSKSTRSKKQNVSNEIEAENTEKGDEVPTKINKPTRRGRPKRNVEAIEGTRNELIGECLSGDEMNVEIELIEFDVLDDESSEISDGSGDLDDICSIEINEDIAEGEDHIDLELKESFSEPIELLRGATRGGKRATKTGKTNKTASKNCEDDVDKNEESKVEDVFALEEEGNEKAEMQREGASKVKVTKKVTTKGRGRKKKDVIEDKPDDDDGDDENDDCDDNGTADNAGSVKPTKNSRARKSGDITEVVDKTGDSNVSQDNGTDKPAVRSARQGRGRASEGDLDVTVQEEMRSGRACSVQDMTDQLGYEDLGDLVNPQPACADSSMSGGSVEIFSSMVMLYSRLCRLPPSPQHGDVCNTLALHYMDRDQRQAAFYLSDGLAITFRHQLVMNVTRKISKLGLVGEPGYKDLMSQSEKMFSQDMGYFDTMIASIPEDWSVVQVCVVKVGLSWKQMILTRFTKDNAPVVIRLPAFDSPQGCRILEQFTSIQESAHEAAKVKVKADWWSKRFKLNDDMKTLLKHMEHYWLGKWRCGLLPREHCTSTLQQMAAEIHTEARVRVDTGHVELLLLAAKIYSDDKLKACVRELLGTTVKPADVDKVVGVLKRQATAKASTPGHQHVILLLDKSLQHLPWESIPCLQESSVSRMPCLAHVHTQLSFLRAQTGSVFTAGVDLNNAGYTLNPGNDLPKTEERFKAWFKKQGWRGVIGQKPTKEQSIETLTRRDLYMYCGHGSGANYFCSDELEKVNGRAVVVLMGCSSGKLLVRGQLEPAGIMMSYFLAGCPCMIGNLWDVTDKDIDMLTEEFLNLCVSAPHGTYLPTLLHKARSVCKLKYINGCAPAVYGLPVFLKKK